MALVGGFTPALADVLVGLEASRPQRDLSISGFELSEDEGDGLSFSFGTDLSNSFLLLKYSEESSVLEPFESSFDLREFSIGWHWNETTAKDGYVGLGVKLQASSYDLDDGFIDQDFYGLGVGVTGTKYLVPGRLFIGGQAWFLAYADPDDGDSSRDESSSGRQGLEGQVFMGFRFGGSASLATIVGYRVRNLDLGDRYFEDEKQEAFVALRLYVASGR